MKLFTSLATLVIIVVVAFVAIFGCNKPTALDKYYEAYEYQIRHSTNENIVSNSEDDVLIAKDIIRDYVAINDQPKLETEIKSDADLQFYLEKQIIEQQHRLREANPFEFSHPYEEAMNILNKRHEHSSDYTFEDCTDVIIAFMKNGGNVYFVRDMLQYRRDPVEFTKEMEDIFHKWEKTYYNLPD